MTPTRVKACPLAVGAESAAGCTDCASRALPEDVGTVREADGELRAADARDTPAAPDAADNVASTEDMPLK